MNLIRVFRSRGIFLVYFLVAVTIAASLVSSNFFVYKSMSAFFLYLGSVACITIVIGVITVFNKLHFRRVPNAIIPVIGLLLYVIIHSFFFPSTIYSVYIAANCIFIISLFIFFSISPPDSTVLFFLVALFAVIESVICVLQYVGLFASENGYFPVTGSWENPNVTAMFIAMAVPSLFLLPESKNRVWNFVMYGTALLFVASLLLLKCRSAEIGAVVGAAYLLGRKYRLFEKVAEKRNRSLVILVAIVILGLTVSLGNNLYNGKKASADGRGLIWKITGLMIEAKPLTGYGYGTFEKNYNLSQAAYFQDGNGTTAEAKNAGFVKMAYNEFLQSAAEGGFLGLLLFSAMLFYLLRAEAVTSKSVAAKAGVAMFTCMSAINFTVQAIPVMCLFVIYAAISSTEQARASYSSRSDTRRFSRTYSLAYSFCSIIAGIVGGIYLIAVTRANVINGIALQLSKKGLHCRALALLESVKPTLMNYESFWTNYSDNLLGCEKYAQAIAAYQLATTLTSDPHVYLNLAKADEQLENYAKAQNALSVAENIQPNRLLPKYRRMLLYAKTGDTAHMVTEAQTILHTVPKISSKEALQYQLAANRVLTTLGTPYRLNPNGTWTAIKPLYFTRKNI